MKLGEMKLRVDPKTGAHLPIEGPYSGPTIRFERRPISEGSAETAVFQIFDGLHARVSASTVGKTTTVETDPHDGEVAVMLRDGEGNPKTRMEWED